MRIKNLEGHWGPIKKLDSFTFETSKNHLIRNFLRNGRLRVKIDENKPDLQGALNIVFLKSHLFLVRGLTEAVFLERQRSYLINLGISNRS